MSIQSILSLSKDVLQAWFNGSTELAEVRLTVPKLALIP
jgi:hypothetical protein